MGQSECCSTCSDSIPFDGFYLGVSLGVAANKVKFDSQAEAFAALNGIPSTVTLSSNASIAKNHIWGEVYAGGGFTFCRTLYLGPRLGVNFSSFDMSYKPRGELNTVFPPAFPVTLQLVGKGRVKLQPVEYTLDAKGGIVLWCNTLLYGLVGVAANQPTLWTSPALEGSASTGFVSASIDQEISRRRRGEWAHFRWGCGLDALICEGLKVGAFYTHTNYGTIERSAVEELVVIPNLGSAGISGKTRAKVRREVIAGSLSYSF